MASWALPSVGIGADPPTVRHSALKPRNSDRPIGVLDALEALRRPLKAASWMAEINCTWDCTWTGFSAFSARILEALISR
jgi:hypothetical protein